MARLKMLSVYDSKIAGYMTPFFSVHAGQALRGWEEVCNDGQSPMSKFPADFTLFELGEFDDSCGELVMHKEAVNLGTAASFKRKIQSEFEGLKNVKA